MTKNILTSLSTSFALIISACVFSQSANAGFFYNFKPATEESMKDLPEGIYLNLEPNKVDVN